MKSTMIPEPSPSESVCLSLFGCLPSLMSQCSGTNSSCSRLWGLKTCSWVCLEKTRPP